MKNESAPKKKLLSTGEVARLVRYSTKTLNAKADSGVVNLQRVNGCRIWTAEDVEAIKKHREASLRQRIARTYCDEE